MEKALLKKLHHAYEGLRRNHKMLTKGKDLAKAYGRKWTTSRPVYVGCTCEALCGGWGGRVGRLNPSEVISAEPIKAANVYFIHVHYGSIGPYTLRECLILSESDTENLYGYSTSKALGQDATELLTDTRGF
ncbi:hypothetical protein IFM89_025223 [Coptis chinensis]|uniref:Uncharacterized protein n=1 Tax=Coptis chinensis TaxID=261450 RepID=A0A835H2H3_9MAGN|nr:hypothetical protein IFM89_025223 [Coptis chinensis]